MNGMDRRCLLGTLVHHRGIIAVGLLFFILLYVPITLHNINRSGHHSLRQSGYVSSIIGKNKNLALPLSKGSTLNTLITSDHESMEVKNNHSYLSLYSNFHYDQNIDIAAVVKEYKVHGKTSVKPLFKYPYKFLNSPSLTCSGENRTLSLLLLIKTALGNFPRRQAIRKTWGNQDNYHKITVKRVFLLGLSKLGMENEDIEGEIRSYRDIVRISFFDAYYNNTLKTIGGLKWATEHCSNAQYVVTIDDDFYIAPDLLWHHLYTLPKKDYETMFLGKFAQKRVQRVSSGRWYVSVEDWPYDTYPTYLHAGAIAMSWTFCRDLYIASMYTKPFKFDDVYLGILCDRLRVIPQGNWNFVMDTHMLLKQYHRFAHTFAAHGFGKPEMLIRAWNLHNDIVRINW